MDQNDQHRAQRASTPLPTRLSAVLSRLRKHKTVAPPELAAPGPQKYYIRVRVPRRFLLAVLLTKRWMRRHRIATRIICIVLVLVILAGIAIDVLRPRVRNESYKISDKAQSFLTAPVELYAQKLVPDPKTGDIVFNKDYQPGSDVAGQSNAPKVTATFSAETKSGVSVEDPTTKTQLRFKPRFDVDVPQKDQNRVVYPVSGRNANIVYTLKANGIKEDIILNSFQGDKLAFKYDIEVSDGTEARIENDGSLAVYGADSALLGNVSTGTDKDVQLLKTARDKATKNQLIFQVPAPFIVQANHKESSAKAWFTLENKVLTVHAEGLKGATYPLSIDPTVYITTASQFMRGNNETNIDFDVSNELIQKGKTTGARFDSWTSTLALPAARWEHATAVAGGYIYVTGGNNGTSNQTTVYWSKFNASTYALQSPNPGAGACTNWCNASVYDLPAARAGHSMVAYNGYLYVMGGFDASNARTTSVYIAKIGANGEPSLWHPTDPVKANWVYWFPSTVALTTERTFAAAAAYNNRLYFMGGQTNAATGGVTTVEYANINPIGTFGSWTSTGMVALPSVRHNHTMQVYNDRMYLIGGNSAGTLQSSVQYIKMASDGTMTGSWTTTTAFTTARMAWGGSFSTIWGGYIYISGGCTAINGSGYCTTIASDVQLASINADGSVTDWGAITGVTSARLGYGLVAWRNTLYGIGGCTAQNTSTGACTTTATLTEYGAIKTDGEASTVSNSVPSGTAPCTGTAYDCDMPPSGTGAGQGGRMSGGTVINNGFIYYIGGCTAVNNNSICFTGNASKTADNISYASIAVDGTLVAPGTCPGTSYGAWCVETTNTENPNNGLAGFGITVFNNVIYVVGGTDGTTWQANIWRASLNSNGSINAWTSQTYAATGLGAYSGYQYVFSRANPSSAGTYPGNLYVIGGCGGATAASSGLDCSSIQYTTVYKCNINTTGAIEKLRRNYSPHYP